MRSTDLEHDRAERAMHMSHGMPPKSAAALLTTMRGEEASEE